MDGQRFLFQGLINHRFSKTIIKILSLVSLFIANVIVLSIFSYFFDIPLKRWYFWIPLLLVGFLFSLITIKTNYVFCWKIRDKQQGNKNTKEESVKIPKIRHQISNIGLPNFLILLIRFFFFNILNDLFILIIIWIIIFAIIFLLGLIGSPNNFTNLATTITLIGVLSGFFQFYIKNYKEDVSMNINNSLSRYITKTIDKISLIDFLKSLDGENKEDIQKIVSSKEKVICSFFNPNNRKRPFTLINMPALINDVSIFYNIEYLVEEKLVKGIGLDSGKLNTLYKTYFEKKFNKFKTDIDKKDFIGIRKLLFSNLIFLDETIAGLEAINLEYDKEKEPEGFKEHYDKFYYDCCYYLLDFMLNFKQVDGKDEMF